MGYDFFLGGLGRGLRVEGLRLGFRVLGLGRKVWCGVQWHGFYLEGGSFRSLVSFRGLGWEPLLLILLMFACFFFFSEELSDEHVEFTDPMVFADQTPVLSGGLLTAPMLALVYTP